MREPPVVSAGDERNSILGSCGSCCGRCWIRTSATHAPTPVFERAAAAAERTYVLKDFGRLGKVVAVMLALLVVSGFAVEQLLR
jgi:hypothetical protein